MILLKIFLERSDINVNDIGCGHTSLVEAGFHDRGTAVEMLLKHPQVDVNAAGTLGRTALHFAAHSGNLNVIKSLLGHSAVDATIENAGGRTAFDFDVSDGRHEAASEIKAFIANSGPRSTSHVA